MKYLVVVDESAFTVLKKYKTEPVCLIIDDNIKIPDWVSQKYSIIPVHKMDNKDELGICEEFTRSFEKLKELDSYNRILLPHINGIYEYVITVISKIYFTVKNNLDPNHDEIILVNGSKEIKLALYYAIKTPEFKKNTFISRAEVLNPFLYQLFKDRFNVLYKENSALSIRMKYISRVVMLFIYTYLKSFLKHMSHLLKRNSTLNISINDLENKKIIVFPLRSNPQFDFAESINSAINKDDKEHSTVVIYYEMLGGVEYMNRLITSKVNYFSLYRWKYLGFYLTTPIKTIGVAIKSYFRNKGRVISFKIDGLSIKVPISYLSMETIAFEHIALYEDILNIALRDVSKIIGKNLKTFCSTELIGIQSIVELNIANRHDMQFVNIQTVAVNESYYPLKIIGDPLFCLTASSVKKFTDHSILKYGEAVYIGSLKYLGKTLIDNQESNFIILFATQPYESDLTIAFLSKLEAWSLNKPKIKIRLRIHPRDNPSLYSHLKTVEIVKSQETVIQSICSSHLVLTRTSSVILDAIELGKPFLACILSNFDKSIELDFLKYEPLNVNNFSELKEKFNDIEEVNNSFESFCSGFLNGRESSREIINRFFQELN